MLQDFKKSLKDEVLLPDGSKVLLAVSGGADSVAMAHLFLELGWPVGIAHCNFQLRGEASDEDERFVRSLAESWELPIYTATFDTQKAASQGEVSVQMAARALRYEWLETTRQREGFTHIATAHHLNDSIETLFYNLSKGCGIHGLHGIPARNGLIIRPLLFATRHEVEQYIEAQGLLYREDASNAEDKYARNKIRHHAIPVFRQLNPSFESTMADNLKRFQEAEYLYGWALRLIAQQAIDAQGRQFKIRKSALQQHLPALNSVLFELLSPYGFNTSQAWQIAENLEHTGAIFEAPEYRLLVGREHLVVEPLAGAPSAGEFIIGQEEGAHELPAGRLSLENMAGRPKTFPEDEWSAFLDAAALRFPLRLRRWRAGDAFQPLGMRGKHQKLQDFFSNHKVSRFDKERIWILEDAQGRICWVVGHRIDERFKLSSDTQAYWALNFKP